MVYTLIDNDIRYHSDQNVVDSRGAAAVDFFYLSIEGNWNDSFSASHPCLRSDKGIAWHADASSVVCTLIDNGKLASQIATLPQIEIIFSPWELGVRRNSQFIKLCQMIKNLSFLASQIATLPQIEIIFSPWELGVRRNSQFIKLCQMFKNLSFLASLGKQVHFITLLFHRSMAIYHFYFYNFLFFISVEILKWISEQGNC